MDPANHAKGASAAGLARSLMVFLAQRRNGTLTSATWLELKDEALKHLRTEDEKILRSTFLALKEEASYATDDEWKTVNVAVQRQLLDDGRAELLSYFQTELFTRVNATTRNPTSLKRAAPTNTALDLGTKRPRHLSPYDDEKAKREKYDLDDHRNTLYQDTFYLLKTKTVAPCGQSIGLDDIVIAGANLAVVCNYKIDMAWMWNRAPGLQASQKLLIVHGDSDVEEEEWRCFAASQGASGRVRFARPRTPPYGTVHSKMFLLFFDNGCRVCIHTANMIDIDWDYKTQGAYVRDFPAKEKLRNGSGRTTDDAADASDFQLQLERYFRHALSGQDREDVLCRLSEYDFSSAGVVVVSSVPGMHTGPAKMHFGHARLREVLQQEKIPESRRGSVAVCQFSSLGSIQEKWLEDEFKNTLFASSDQAGPDLNAVRPAANHLHEIKLIFPTLQQVRDSNEGLSAGASLPVSQKNLDREHITSKLHKWDAKRKGRDRAMPHIKTFLRYNQDQPQSPLWFFLGSFNLSVAAWGRMQGGRKGKKLWDRLNVLSYEIGVLFSPRLSSPPKHSLGPSVTGILLSEEDCRLWEHLKTNNLLFFSTDEEQARAHQNVITMATTATTVASPRPFTRGLLRLPLPYTLPPPKYTAGDTPWNTNFCTMA